MSFEALPRELQLIIASDHLCFDPVKAGSDAESSTFDRKLALDFAVVSPSCRDIVFSVLLRRVRVTKPTALRSLFSLLSNTPAFAAHVRSIHLGPDTEPAHRFERWPIANAGYGWPNLSLNSTLTEGHLVPPWFSTVWSDWHHKDACTAVAISGAIDEAVKGLDLEPWRKGYSKSGLHIGIRAWASRVFLLGAALDLYIMQMRRVEDAPGFNQPRQGRSSYSGRCWWDVGASTCSHTYPRLRILFDASRLKDQTIGNDGDDVFTITESQLWERIDRQDGPADDFDHPTFLTTSTRHGLGMTQEEWSRVRDDLHGPGPPQVYTDAHWRQLMGYDPYHELDPVYDPFEKLPSGLYRSEEATREEKEAGRQRAPSPSSDDFDWRPDGPSAKRRADRAEDLIAMARYIFSLTPQATNVSLTSLLFQSLPALQADSLLSLTIGPKARYWNDVLPADVTSFKNLQRLRVVGMMSKDDASKIARELPSLERVEWEVTDEQGPESSISAPSPFAPLDVKSVYDVVCHLQGQSSPVSTCVPSTDMLGKRRRSSSEEREAENARSNLSSSSSIGINEARPMPSSKAAAPSPPSPDSPPSKQRTTLVLLRADVASLVCRMTPTAAIRRAWETGRAVENTLHPVRVGVSKAVGLPQEASKHDYTDEMRALYEAGKRWWEEGHAGAASSGDGGGDGGKTREKEKKLEGIVWYHSESAQ